MVGSGVGSGDDLLFFPYRRWGCVWSFRGRLVVMGHGRAPNRLDGSPLARDGAPPSTWRAKPLLPGMNIRPVTVRRFLFPLRDGSRNYPVGEEDWEGSTVRVRVRVRVRARVRVRVRVRAEP